MVNGGFPIYGLGSGEVVGFIQADATVTDAAGRNLGVCQGATVTDTGVLGDCVVSSLNPNSAQSNSSNFQMQTAPLPGATPQDTNSQPDTQPDSRPSNPDGTQPYPQPKDPNCPDTRNGDFDPSYSPDKCNSNGYYWCSVTKACLDKPINVNECGELASREY